MRARELRAQGLSDQEAWRAAVAAFGDPEHWEREVVRMDERMRARHSLRDLIASFAQDVRYAARFLSSRRLFAAVAIGTLALGIGATTAIYSLLDATLLRRPGVVDPSSVVALYTTCRLGAPRCSSSYPDYVDYRDRAESLADLAASSPFTASLGDEARGSRLVAAELVSGNFFELLGVAPAMGRVLQPADDPRGAGAPVAVLSHTLWGEHFGEAPGVVGATIRLNGAPFEVVGVASAAFDGLSLSGAPDLWVPLQASSALIPSLFGREEIFEQRGSRWIGRLVGRLAPGATPEQARAELLALSERMREESPAARGPRSITLDALGRYLVPTGSEESLPQFVWLLMGVVGVTLLLACANLANLMLARAASRGTEMGIRIAIGAGRRRLVRQLLAESLLLSALGGAAALLVARGLLALLGSFELPGGIAIGGLGAGLDADVLLITGGVSALTAVLCGLAPALYASRPDVVEALKSGRAPEARRGAGRVRHTLVAVQVALCVVLLVGSGLFVRALRSALDADLGVQTENVALVRFNLGLIGYGDEEAFRFAEDLREWVLGQPAVRSAALSTLVPLAGGARMGRFAEVEGYDRPPDEELRIDVVYASPGYFETLGIPLLGGRDFGGVDGAGGTEAAIVNREMADRYWQDGEAVGGALLPRAAPGGPPQPIRVVGVAENVHWSELVEDATNFVFLPLAQTPSYAAGTVTLAARTDGDPGPLLAAVRARARTMEPDLSLDLVTTMDEALGDLLMPQRMGALLLSAFALLALALAAVGIAGVVSYTVGQQRRAIGVRMALGARRDQVVRMVLRGMLAPLAVGLLAGLAAAVALDGALERFLYGVAPGDMTTYIAIALGLTFVALAATLLPARAAARIDPVEILSVE
jgi:predicted permease